MLDSRSLRRAFTLIAIVAALAGQSIIAQAGTLGGIAGIVTDSKSGAPVAGARVEITSPSQSTIATTDAKGHYVALSLQPDDYTVTVQKQDYVTQSFRSYSVFADQTQLYDFKLDPAQDAAQQSN